jgi:hypothetical protein
MVMRSDHENRAAFTMPSFEIVKIQKRDDRAPAGVKEVQDRREKNDDEQRLQAVQDDAQAGCAEIHR